MLKIAMVAVPALLFLSACSSHTRTYSTSDGTVSVETKGKDDSSSVRIKGKDGASVDFNTGKPITDYPGDVPLYGGKTVMDMKIEKEHTRAVSIQTSDSMDKVSDFYKSKLSSDGWKTDTTMSGDKMTLYTATKGNHRLVVSISSDASLQTVSQQLTDKE